MPTASRAQLWGGRILSALPVLLLLFSATLKLCKTAMVIESMVQYGYSSDLLVPIGVLEVLCTLVYVIPQTSFLGAILLTGYLGGATATNVRVGNHSYVMTFLLGVLVWTGLYLRDARLRQLIPINKENL